MKKKVLSIIYLVVALCIVVFVQSCKKENTIPQRFYATLQQYNGDKVYINDHYSFWEVGDEVKIGTNTGRVGEENGRYFIQVITEGGFFAYGDATNQGNNALAALYL